MLTIVYIPGCWDLLHVGHLAMLERAKAMGDRLVVGVADDLVVEEDKGKEPIIGETERVRMLQALKCVDVAITYHALEFLSHLEMIHPNVMVVGSTWGNQRRHNEAELWCAENDCNFVLLPYTEGVSTSLIKGKILQDHNLSYTAN